jgi:hypothetical protein
MIIVGLWSLGMAAFGTFRREKIVAYQLKPSWLQRHGLESNLDESQWRDLIWVPIFGSGIMGMLLLGAGILALLGR